MGRKIDLSKTPESHCPRWSFCNINKCPLFRDYENLDNDSSDFSKTNKEKCTSKNVRKEIGKAFGLKFGGMTSREFAGFERWEALSEHDKTKKLAKLRQLSPFISAGGIIPQQNNIIAQNKGKKAKNGSNNALEREAKA